MGPKGGGGLNAPSSVDPTSPNPAAELAISGQVRVLPIGEIRPAPVNDTVYKPIDLNCPSPGIVDLARDVDQRGILEPIVVSADGYIISGHRRYAAASLAGLTEVPARIATGVYSTAPDFLTLLVAFNKQREKTLDEVLREQTIQAASPQEAHRALTEFREQKARVDIATIALRGEKTRSAISGAKMPFLNAAIAAIERLQDYLPVSVRQLHYQLLNDPPLTHAGKPDSRYSNTLRHYKQLSDLLTRARIEGLISMNVIADETRPVTNWAVHAAPADYLRQELDSFLRGYWRNYQQSQPNHIEIIGEKNTLTGIVRPVAEKYAIPYTTGRGFCSTPPKHDMAQRFFRSGKEKLILLSLSDFDPEGEEITHSFARDLRDEHGVRSIVPVKVALTQEQVQRLGLVPSMEAKTGSANYQKFVSRYGIDVFELESVPPETLRQMLRDAIDSVLDVAAYNAEVAREAEDAQYIDSLRQRALLVLQGEVSGA